MSDLHVIPVGDLVSHDCLDDCVCGPVQVLVSGEHGDGWVSVHSALDGRR